MRCPDVALVGSASTWARAHRTVFSWQPDKVVCDVGRYRRVTKNTRSLPKYVMRNCKFMDLRLVDKGWNQEFGQAVENGRSSMRFISPFIKLSAAKRLLSAVVPERLQIITRFNLCDFAAGVSDIDALRLFLEVGATVRGIRNLHAKVFLFGDAHAIVGSANLTDAAMLRNHEFGVVGSDLAFAAKCQDYFEGLWQRAGPNLIAARLTSWDETLLRHLLKGGRLPKPSELPDFGADAALEDESLATSPWANEGRQGFVKFFGEGTNRAATSMSVLDEVKASGSHFACTYPLNRRPRQVKDGAQIFMGRMTKKPDDILIYGRAIGLAHNPERDVASSTEIEERPWKKDWPNYIRVHSAKFVSGTLGNCVSLYDMMIELKADSFFSTQRRSRAGTPNINPKTAYGRQPAVQLTAEAIAWLDTRLDEAFCVYGSLTPSQLDELDWPL
jgi:PLD-like domain